MLAHTNNLVYETHTHIHIFINICPRIPDDRIFGQVDSDKQ